MPTSTRGQRGRPTSRMRTSMECSSRAFRSTGRAMASALRRPRVLWGGTSGGITGIHEWVFGDTPDGVQLTTTESFAGEPVEADAQGMQTLLDASLAAWLAH